MIVKSLIAYESKNNDTPFSNIKTNIHDTAVAAGCVG